MRRTKTWPIVIASVVAFASVSPARAQQNFREPEFRSKDKNKDGHLSRDEYAGHPGNFRALDDDGDGRLSFDEYVNRAGNRGAARPADPVAPPPDAVAQRHAARDTDNDGVIERYEWRDEPGLFGRADRNDDGRVTLDEYRSPEASGDVDDRFRARDRDRDGVLSWREWRGGEPVAFERADRDGDGVVSLREYDRLPTTGSRGRDYDRDYAWERGSRRGDDRVFDELDRNRDGRISRSEWPDDSESFTDLDTSRDRSLSASELRDRGRLRDRFRRLDWNNDGRVSAREWDGSRGAFDFFDRNGDGTITADEY
jgi:Ca2+-binding EF-hand superfamily protein